MRSCSSSMIADRYGGSGICWTMSLARRMTSTKSTVPRVAVLVPLDAQLPGLTSHAVGEPGLAAGALDGEVALDAFQTEALDHTGDLILQVGPREPGIAEWSARTHYPFERCSRRRRLGLESTRWPAGRLRHTGGWPTCRC